jgi:hypothetical protein
VSAAPPAPEWTWPESLDAMQAAPDHHRVLLENEHVRVLESWVAPGDTVPVHTHRWPGVLHVLSWSDFVRYGTDGAVVLDSRSAGPAPQPGSVLWGAALAPHSLKNVGDAEIRIVTVEVKRSG